MRLSSWAGSGIMPGYEPGGAMSFEKADAPHPDDTIAAVSSAPGPGLRAIVRVSGPKTREVVVAVFTEAHPSQRVGLRRLTPGSLRLSGVHSPLPADLY